jgi:type II secretory pathway component PulJ
MSRRLSDSRAGFTLLEVVLAMTSLVMVTAICYAAFHLGMRAVERGEVSVVTAQRLRVASDVLIRQVKSAVPYPVRTEDDEVYPFFVGTPSSMSFITAAAQQGGGALARVTYTLQDNPPRLMITESPSFSSDGLGRDRLEHAGERTTVLLDGFRTLRFQYLLDDGTDSEWRSSWDAREEEILPNAIRITVDGLPGLEVDTWGQEIPIMVSTLTEGGAEANEESLADKTDQQQAGGQTSGPGVAGGEGGGGGSDEEASESDDDD